jgi:SPW repeat
MKQILIPRVDRRPLAGGAVILWVALSPWVWGFADSHAAVANHIALVFGFGPLALLIVNLRPAAFVTLLGGLWLVMSPWLLGYATDHTAWLNELVSGLLLVVLCADAAGVRALMRARRKRGSGQRRASTRAVAETAESRS